MELRVLTPTLPLLFALTGLAAALMAGVYFAFSAFIMAALAGMERGAGVAAMNAINRVILRSLFMPLFLGSTMACLAVGVAAALYWSAPGSPAALAGAALYVLGMFGVTMAFNVPLNNSLVAAENDGALWAEYLRTWTRWNHVRTLASLGAAALLLMASGQSAMVSV